SMNTSQQLPQTTEPSYSSRSDRLFEAVSKMYDCRTIESCPSFQSQSGPLENPPKSDFFKPQL
ncbi:MAG: hypothetical protein ACYCZO_02460, partial [Daejeonella sp.]